MNNISILKSKKGTEYGINVENDEMSCSIFDISENLTIVEKFAEHNTINKEDCQDVH